MKICGLISAFILISSANTAVAAAPKFKIGQSNSAIILSDGETTYFQVLKSAKATEAGVEAEIRISKALKYKGIDCSNPAIDCDVRHSIVVNDKKAFVQVEVSRANDDEINFPELGIENLSVSDGLRLQVEIGAVDSQGTVTFTSPTQVERTSFERPRGCLLIDIVRRKVNANSRSTCEWAGYYTIEINAGSDKVIGHEYTKTQEDDI